MLAEQAIVDIQGKLATLTQLVEVNRIPSPTQGMADRNMTKTAMDMEIYVKPLINNAPLQEQTVDTIIVGD